MTTIITKINNFCATWKAKLPFFGKIKKQMTSAQDAATQNSYLNILSRFNKLCKIQGIYTNCK